MPQPNGRQKIPLGRQKQVSTSRRKRSIRKITPYRFASTCLITGYLHFSRDIRKKVECSFILLEDLTIFFFFQNESDYSMELRRIELWAFRMRSEHPTTELQPLDNRDYQYVSDTCFLSTRLFSLPWSCGGLNSGLLTCEASTLPLSYNPLTFPRLL